MRAAAYLKLVLRGQNWGHDCQPKMKMWGLSLREVNAEMARNWAVISSPYHQGTNFLLLKEAELNFTEFLLGFNAVNSYADLEVNCILSPHARSSWEGEEKHHILKPGTLYSGAVTMT